WLDKEPLSHLISYIPADLGVKLNPTRLKSTPMLSLIGGAGMKLGGARPTTSASTAAAPRARLLNADIGSPSLRASGTAASASNNQPIQHIHAQFRPDRYQISLDLHHSQL